MRWLGAWLGRFLGGGGAAATAPRRVSATCRAVAPFAQAMTRDAIAAARGVDADDQAVAFDCTATVRGVWPATSLKELA